MQVSLARAVAFALLVLAAASGACAAGSTGPRAPAAAAAIPQPAQRRLPLTGRIWEITGARFADEEALLASAQRAPFVLLGEQHDDPEHHRIEARVLAALIAAGRRPAVVFEMLDLDRQPEIDRVLAAHATADELAAAVDWEHSGWPSFALYRPIFEHALDAGLRIVAGNVPRSEAMRIGLARTSALDADFVARFGLDAPLPEDTQRQLESEMADAHCGLLPAEALGTLVSVQRLRDARMAERLHASSAQAPIDGAVLIAGAGHVRADRGVPAALARAYGASSLAIALLEAVATRNEPAAYAEQFGAPRLPFAFAWFTPRANEVDHCEELRKTMSHPEESKNLLRGP